MIPRADDPLEEAVYMGLYAPSHGHCAAVVDAVDQVENVPAPQIGDGSVTPCRNKLALENPLDLPFGLVLRLVAQEPLSGNGFEVVGRLVALTS